MDKGALFTTTVLMSALPTIFMALYAKQPLALAPGMGLNAFFAYTICDIMEYSWQFALTAVFFEGLVFMLLTVTNLREKIVEVIPNSLKNAIGAGIGLYIAFIGLKNGGVIVSNEETLVSLSEPTYTMGLSIIGIIITSVLLVKRVKGALLFGILATTLVGIPMGLTSIDGVASLPPSVEPIFMKFTWDSVFTKDMAIIVFTLLFVDLFDCIGTVIGVSQQANMLDKNGKIPALKKIFMVDSISTTAGAMMGTSTVAVYVESAAGVNEGGRSGMTAFVTGLCFLVALFFSPLFMAIPPSATTPVLVLVGLMMMSSVLRIDFSDYSEAIPAFICILLMPLTYSISDGIVLGHLSYVLINFLSGKRKKITTGMYVLAAIFVLKFFV
jgi:AGZA family xanthine/uracil permease-like MFS transporter